MLLQTGSNIDKLKNKPVVMDVTDVRKKLKITINNADLTI
jgi:hypothetical protein